MAARTLLLTVTAMAALAAVAHAQENLNTFSWMASFRNGQACVDTWNALQNQFYTGSRQNEDCGVTVKRAMDTFVPSQCPGGPPPTGDRPGGALWNCMTGNGNNTALKNAWVNFVKNCEIFYIAYRVPGESESGFKSRDNSCLRKFENLASFRGYLNTQVTSGGGGTVTQPPVGSGGNGGNAEALVVRTLPVLFAFVAAAAFLLLL